MHTAARIASSGFFVLFLLTQTAVPLCRLAVPRPARFGWHMFTAKRERVRFSVVLRDGSHEPVNLAAYVAQSRGEVDVEKALPPHLCRMVPEAAAVEIHLPDSGRTRVYECR